MGERPHTHAGCFRKGVRSEVREIAGEARLTEGLLDVGLGGAHAAAPEVGFRV
jgi:hypothetical protein